MKARRKKALILFVSALAILLVTAAIVIPRLIDPNRYHTLIVSQVEQALGGEVTLGHIHWTIFDGIRLEVAGFSMTGDTSFPAHFRIPHISAEVSIFPLLFQKVIVEELLLSSPQIEFHFDTAIQEDKKSEDQDQNVSLPGAAPPVQRQEDGSSDPGIRVLIETVRLEGGELILKEPWSISEQQAVHHFDHLSATGRNILGQSMFLDLSMTDTSDSGLGTVKAHAAFTGLTQNFNLENPRLKIQITIPSIGLNRIQARLGDRIPPEALRGDISLKMNYENDFTDQFRIGGVLDLSRVVLTYADFSLPEKTSLPSPSQITYDLQFGQQNLEIRHLGLMTGNLVLNGHGTILDWATAPVINNAVVDGTLPFKEISSLIPWRKMSEPSAPLGKLIKSDGTVVIEEAVFPQLNLSKPPDDLESLLLQVEARLRFHDVSVPKFLHQVPGFRKITGRVNLKEGVLSGNDMIIRMGNILLPDLNFRATELTGLPKISVTGKGPLQLATGGKTTDAFLLEHGIRKLDADTHADFSGYVDFADPEAWEMNGSFILKKIGAESYPTGVTLNDLHGTVKVIRKGTLNITLSDFKGLVNQALFRVDGKFLNIGTPEMIVDVTSRVDHLNLQDVVALIEPLKEAGLSGQLDLDTDIYLNRAALEQTRMTGRAGISDLAMHLKDSGIQFRKVRGKLILNGDHAIFKDFSFQLNNQTIRVTGQLRNPREPKVILTVTSPDLDLDSLIPSQKKSEGLKEKAEEIEQAGRKHSVDIFSRMTAKIDLAVEKGRYQDQDFENLLGEAKYENGEVTSFKVETGIGGGRILSKGSVDLRNSPQIGFFLEPDIQSVKIEKLFSLVGEEKPTIFGPVSLAGNLSGKGSNTDETIKNLNGEVVIQCGPGRLTALGAMGNTLTKILSFLSVDVVQVKKNIKELKTKGMPFNEITGIASVKNGTAMVKGLSLKSDALNLTSEGKIDFTREEIDMIAEVQVFQTLDKVLDWLPLIGKTSSRLTKIYLSLKGPWKNPTIRPTPTKTLTEPIKELWNIPKGLKK